MSDDPRNDQEKPKPQDAKPDQQVTDDPTRREFIAGTIPVITLGGLVSAGIVSLSEEADAAGMRVVTLTVKLPENVQLKTNIERIPGKSLELDQHQVGQEVRHLSLDLTTAKTQNWLRPHTGKFNPVGADCCCVRG